MKRQIILLSLLLGSLGNGFAETATSLPRLDEVYQLLRANQKGLADDVLDQAAVKGLLAELQSQVVLVTNAVGSGASVSNMLNRVSVLDNAFGYFRFGQIETGLNDTFKSAYQKLISTNKIKGVVLDLRYTRGTDYGAAAKTADFFLSTEQPLVRWGDASAKSSTKTNAISIPVAVLVNHKTAGAAEALAAILREGHVGLVIGTNTAGQASVFKEFTLKSGDRLKVATAPVQLGNGNEIPQEGLKPDIEIALGASEERAFYDDPYRPSARVVSKTGADLASSSETNTTRRRLNEAELVRLQREGVAPEDDVEPPVKKPGTGRATIALDGPVLSDPTLIRALDLLKGLSVIQQSRRF
ncbi:MAG: S41 family peptidase [Verrucomicrobiota bacterium]